MVLEQLIAVFDFAFSPFLSLSPHLSLLIVSTLITVVVMGINRLATNRRVAKELKDKLENIREQLTAAQKANDKENTSKYLAEMMKTNSEYMKTSFKAMIISIVVLSLFLPWLNHTYEGKVVARLPFSVPYFGTSISWIIWYVAVSFAVGWILRKILGIDYG